MFVKMTANGYIIGVGISAIGDEITEFEYNTITDKIHAIPMAPEGYVYMLNASTLEWELVEVEPEEPTAEEALDILLGGAE